jgi:hypothetical protein
MCKKQKKPHFPVFVNYLNDVEVLDLLISSIPKEIIIAIIRINVIIQKIDRGTQ